MGGSLTCAIRRSNGEVWHRGVWTNSLPFTIKSHRFLAEEESVVKAFQDSWPGDDDEWWGRNDNFAPKGYGLVVVDFMKKKIYSMQGYCDFDTLDGCGISLGIPSHSEEIIDPSGKRIYNKVIETYEEAVNIFYRGEDYSLSYIEMFFHYAREGKLKFFIADENHRKSMKGYVLPPTGLTDKDYYYFFIANYLKKNSKGYTDHVTFIIDISPFESIYFEENSHGMIAMRNKLIEDGFVFSKEDDKHWDSAIADRKEFEEECKIADEEKKGKRKAESK